MNTKVSVKEKLCYGIGSGGGNIITQILGTFLTAYYTDSVGIAAAAIGTMMLLTRLLDGVSDILMGGIIDKTKTKWGKARPWILISAPLICIGLILTFNVPASLSDGAKLVYAYITYIFLNCITFTAYMISHTALLSRMTLDVNDRQTMTSINQIINNIVQLIVTGFTIKFVTMWGWRSVSIGYGLITALMLLICFWGVREHLDMNAETEEVKIETVPLKEAVPAILKNKYFYLVAALFILALSIASGNGSMTVYYCGNILENMDMMTPLSMALTLPVIVGNFFVPAIVKKLGHQKTLILSSILMLAGFLIVAINPYNATFAIVGTVVRGFGNGAIFACGFALSAQVVDYGEWKFHVRSEGLLNSCVSFGQKVGLGLGAAIASWIIAAGGYVGTAEVQTAAAKSSIVFAYVWFGVILAALLLVVSILLNIDKYEDQIKKELEERHNR
ncbi:MAG: MFS transporter [Dorea sp.]